MHSIALFMKKITLFGAVFVLSSFTLLMSSGIAFADEEPCIAPPDSSYGAGVHHPTGSDAVAFTYNCDTGTWQSQYYTYYPASNTRVANYSPDYDYDCAAGKWYMTQYYFSAADGAYHFNRVATGDPGLPTGCPVAPSAPVDNPANTAGANGSGGISNTGPGSSNTTNGNVTLNGATANNTNMNMSNIIIGGANTGNSYVIGNTTAGSAGTGDAQSVANIANLLQSTANVFGPGTATFTANINGDVTGDFMFDPAAIMNTGPGSTNGANDNLTVNTTDTNTTNAQINNNIDVGATSGNALVANNTTGGSASSGNAQAIVNLMNLINSSVASGQSFVGTININGNLNGDILLPQGLIDQLLAATGPNSTNSTNAQLTDNSTHTNNVTQNIANTIQSSANTGNASVAGNTTAGSANSGIANTGVTLLNLTGSNTIGKNNILVFVNVLGKWVGMIMNAPTGTNAASLGGGITQTGPNSTNTTNTNVTDNSHTTNNLTQGITNNVNIHAKSGDATVTNNTSGGNATSGNASTAVNILNLEGSNLNLSDWFGVLFINVFGMWNGSFGVNTSAGDPASNPSNNPVQVNTQTAMIESFKQFATFAAGGNGGSTANTSRATTAAVLGSSAVVSQKLATNSASSPLSDPAPHASYWLPVLGFSAAVVLLFISERGRFFGNKK